MHRCKKCGIIIERDKYDKEICFKHGRSNRANILIEKKSNKPNYYIPNGKGRFEFEVVSDDDQSFVVNVQRKGINADNCTYLGRLPEGIVLLRLDVGKNLVHYDEKTDTHIKGAHLHIYSAEYGTEAIPFDVSNKNLLELCMDFFERFHIVEPPTIAQVTSLKGF